MGLPYNKWIGAAATLVLCWLIWRYYDAPVRAWLRRHYGWRRRAPSGQAPAG
jgi:peptidoglycan/LPS O-acetylase OafA/YrhL